MTEPKEINLMEYGVIGDGIVDDTDACQKAINDATPGSCLFLPEGKVIRLTKPVLVPRNIGLCKWLRNKRSIKNEYEEK